MTRAKLIELKTHSLADSLKKTANDLADDHIRGFCVITWHGGDVNTSWGGSLQTPEKIGALEMAKLQMVHHSMPHEYVAHQPATVYPKPMDPQDLVSTLSKVITKRVIQVGVWLFAAVIAVGFGGKALGFW